MPFGIFEDVFLPIANTLNLVAGLLLISDNKRMFRFFLVLLGLLLLTSLLNLFGIGDGRLNHLVNMAVLFPFYAMVTYEIIKQILTMKNVTMSTLLGLISGYICLGLIGALLCMIIEMFAPGSFSGITPARGILPNVEDIVYFSYITLLTIGYGEIFPVADAARKAAILIGLVGQFYMVIITAVVVSKYMSQKN
ncbi:hypothetical protein BST85_12285 [Aureitalea marina]|uniref:Potassium channel domain-containing protein n=2 Tax=Aureitalea marina TaxID=930804 RepID=A0A2S7KSM9_9FLAO|nr:hypothetical protein BST85_12285 [Aureitalea marina]